MALSAFLFNLLILHFCFAILLCVDNLQLICWHFLVLFILFSLLYQLLFHCLLFSLPLRNCFHALQSDDVKLYDNQSDYWRTFIVEDEIAVKHGWQSSRILEATSQGLGKLMASLTYFSGPQETKEVLPCISS